MVHWLKIVISAWLWNRKAKVSQKINTNSLPGFCWSQLMDPQSWSKSSLMQQHLESSYLKANTRAYKTAFQRGLAKAKHRFYPLLPFLPLFLPPLFSFFSLSSFLLEYERWRLGPCGSRASVLLLSPISRPCLLLTWTNFLTLPKPSYFIQTESQVGIYFIVGTSKPQVLVTELRAWPAMELLSPRHSAATGQCVAGWDTLCRVAN